MKPMTRFLSAAAAIVAAAVLGVLAAWPIYETARLWLVAGVAVLLGLGIVAAHVFARVSAAITLIGTVLIFVLTVAPISVPQSLERLPGSLGRGVLDGLGAVAVGWKQLLTLDLPVGGYQTVLVPFYVVMCLVALGVALMAMKLERAAVFAAPLLVAPVAFGTIFGSSVVSDRLGDGLFSIAAPREIGLWLAAGVLGAAWVIWIAGARRRAALKLGRSTEGPRPRSGGALRGLVGAGIVVVALVLGLVCAPLMGGQGRDVARDRVDPLLVVQEQPSPLADYRVSKSDDGIDAPLFSVGTDGELPGRLRIAVLDAYAGVDYHVSPDEAGRFTRFPHGEAQGDTSEITITIDDGYDAVWAPTAPLAEPPTFDGPRADALADGFYVGRETGAAIVAVPGDDGDADGVVGLAPGDSYTAEMATTEPTELADEPAQAGPQIDLEEYPELADWLALQALPANRIGLTEAIERLRQRGYLSHAISDSQGDNVWLQRLSEEYGTRFESSPGGHSATRIERLFGELVDQQEAAGENASEAQLVAGIGDDEQFATAAALIAQAYGYDARVVVGVRLGDGDDAGVPGVPACADACTGENLSAWVEVRGDGGPWVPMDTTPQPVQPPISLEEGEQLPEYPTAPEARNAEETDPPIGLGDQNDGGDGDDTEAGPRWLWAALKATGLSLATLALLALPLLFIPVAKRLRRRRRQRHETPEVVAIGAWQQIVDEARDAGARLPAQASRGAVAAAIGTDPAKWAAAQADRAVFSPRGLSASDAQRVWLAHEAERERRAGELTRWQRIKHAYSLRSFGIMIGRPSSRRGDSADNNGAST